MKNLDNILLNNLHTRRCLHKYLHVAIGEASAIIFQDRGRSGGSNTILVHPDSVWILRSNEFFNEQIEEKHNALGSIIGTMMKKYDVVASPDIKKNKLIILRVDEDSIYGRYCTVSLPIFGVEFFNYQFVFEWTKGGGFFGEKTIIPTITFLKTNVTTKSKQSFLFSFIWWNFKFTVKAQKIQNYED